MTTMSFHWLATILILAAPFARADGPTPTGLWDINGKTTSTIEQDGKTYADKVRSSYHVAQFETGTANSLKTSQGIEWFAYHPLNAVATWSQQGNSLQMAYDLAVLNAGTTTDAGTTPTALIQLLQHQFANGALQAGLLTQPPTKVTATLRSVDDAASLIGSAVKLAGTSKAVADISFHDAADTANPSSQKTAVLTVVTKYKGIRAAAPSTCCAAGTDVAEANLADSRSFLAANRRLPGIKTTPTGLQYKVIGPGYGPQPGAASTVYVWYRGILPNGQVFDGSATSFALTDVIPGWTEGLQYMKQGGWYRFYLPPELAYKQAGSSSIPPNAALIFDVKLWDVAVP